MLENFKTFLKVENSFQKLDGIKKIHTEPRTKKELSMAMNSYYEHVKNRVGSLFMAVCRGKVSSLRRMSTFIRRYS